MNYRVLMAISLCAFTLAGCATQRDQIPLTYRQPVPGYTEPPYRPLDYMDSHDPRYVPAMRNGG